MPQLKRRNGCSCCSCGGGAAYSSHRRRRPKWEGQRHRALRLCASRVEAEAKRGRWVGKREQGAEQGEWRGGEGTRGRGALALHRPQPPLRYTCHPCHHM